MGVSLGKRKSLAELEEVERGAVRVVRVTGEVDLADAEALVERLVDCLRRAQTVEADLGGVTFIDSSGLGALVRWRAEAAVLGRDIALTNVTPATDRLLHLTGLRTLFDVQPAGH